ncbi:MAG: hypothetical protein ACR2HT_01575 [Pyrinomonadaceae bacterium]
MFINGNEIVIHRLNGRISSTGEIKIQVRNSNGRFSNVLRTGVRSE